MIRTGRQSNISSYLHKLMAISTRVEHAMRSGMLQHIPDNDWDDPDTSNNDTGELLIESPTWM